MKYFRIFYTLLLWLLALASLLALLAIAPMVQTWALRLALSGDSGLHGSVEAVSVRFGRVQAADLRLEKDGAVLTLPSFQARMPISSALFRRKVVLERLVAKGWKLDLSKRPKPELPPGESGGKAELREALALLHGALNGWRLPVDLSAETLELEGDIITASDANGTPAVMHVILKGGSLGEGREASFDYDVIGQFFGWDLRLPYLATHGVLTARMDTPRTFDRLGTKTKLVVRSDKFQKDIDWDVEASVARGVGEETYVVDLSKAQRKIASLSASVPSPLGNIQGRWKLNAEQADLAPFAPDRFPKQLAVEGEGRFEADAALARLRLSGRVSGEASGLEALYRPLVPLGSQKFELRFEARHTGAELRVEQLELSLGSPKPLAFAKALQAFDIDEGKATAKLTEPQGDWFEVRLEEAPLGWLGGLTGDYALSGGGVSGSFVVRRLDKGFAVRSRKSVGAKAVALRHGEGLVAQNLDLAVDFSGESGDAGWAFRFGPFEASNSGRPLLSAEGKASLPAKEGVAATLSASWKLDLRALGAGAVVPGFVWTEGTEATGTLTATQGETLKVQGKLRVAYPEPERSLSSDYQIELRGNNTLFFTAPFKVALPSGASDIALEGAWYSGEQGRPLSLKVTSPNCTLEQLRALAVPVAALRSGAGPAEAAKLPFWGEWTGYLSFVFDRFNAWGEDMHDARWTLNLEPRLATLQSGSWQNADKILQLWKGTVAYDPSAKDAYTLQASASMGEADAASLFGKPPAGQDPLFQGRFTVAKSLRGQGSDFADLSRHLEEDYTLEGKGGIVRLLKTNVADALPMPSTPGSDVLGAVGDVVGPIFGRKSGTVGHRQIKLRKNTEAILNFSYDMAEFRYERLKLRATRGTDRILDIEQFDMSSPDLKIVGTGKIVPENEGPLQNQPLSLDLSFSVAGRGADFLIEGGLVPGPKDDKGFVSFPKPLHFGGTLLKFDKTEWHDVLAKAANANPEEKKKEPAKK